MPHTAPLSFRRSWGILVRNPPISGEEERPGEPFPAPLSNRSRIGTRSHPTNRHDAAERFPPLHFRRRHGSGSGRSSVWPCFLISTLGDGDRFLLLFPCRLPLPTVVIHQAGRPPGVKGVKHPGGPGVVATARKLGGRSLPVASGISPSRIGVSRPLLCPGREAPPRAGTCGRPAPVREGATWRARCRDAPPKS